MISLTDVTDLSGSELWCARTVVVIRVFLGGSWYGGSSDTALSTHNIHVQMQGTALCVQLLTCVTYNTVCPQHEHAQSGSCQTDDHVLITHSRQHHIQLDPLSFPTTGQLTPAWPQQRSIASLAMLAVDASAQAPACTPAGATER